MLYPCYVEVLATIDQEIKQIILSDEPIRAGEEIYFSLGSVSFNYKLKSDLGHFDMIQLANSMIDVIITSQLESLEKDHMQVFMVCCGNRSHLQVSGLSESWLKVFQKLKDYLLVSICDPEICQDSLVILHNFLTADGLKYSIFTETKEVFVKSLELLYRGEMDSCKALFREYLLGEVVNRTEDADNSLKKFFKSVLQNL